LGVRDEEITPLPRGVPACHNPSVPQQPAPSRRQRGPARWVRARLVRTASVTQSGVDEGRYAERLYAGIGTRSGGLLMGLRRCLGWPGAAGRVDPAILDTRLGPWSSACGSVWFQQRWALAHLAWSIMPGDSCESRRSRRVGSSAEQEMIKWFVCLANSR